MHLKTADPETRIRELTEEIESLSYSISHDLRAPLRAITGFSRILLRDYADRLDPEGRELLQMMHDAGRNLNGMIEALLAYSRVERRAMALSELNMEALADEQIAFCRSKFPQRNVRFVRGRFAPATGDRLHSSEQYEGVGGGLAIARRIIQRHGGRIWAESKPDAGATFYFILG
jgi:signal transduction histidine kinase